jgi:hypothetical protein
MDHLQRRLEAQIQVGDYSSSINPIKLSQRIRILHESLQKLQKRVDVVNHKKETLMPQLFEQFCKNAMVIHQLRCHSGLKSCGIPDNVFSDFYDEIMRFEQKELQSGNMMSNETSMMTATPALDNDASSNDMCMATETNTMQSSSEQRVELTEDDFNNLPPLTKQRATYDQVEAAYNMIKKLYNDPPKKQRKPVPIKTLANAGVKLTGSTGTAVLNCLRSLKLIRTNKRGVICNSDS